MIKLKLSELESVIEALLFLSGDAVPLASIASAIKMDKATARAIVTSVSDRYQAEKRGLRIIELNGSYQMCTSPQCFGYLQEIYSSGERQGISETLLETLAIIAYKQPVTKVQIEEIRGVSAEHSVNKLIEKGLICEKGRLDSPGRPILFGTTEDFLRYFGFSSLKELPHLEAEIAL